MKALFDIEGYHEYEEGCSPHLSFVPLAYLRRHVSNNRLWFRHAPGYLKCYCEDDLALLSEEDALCFWVTYTSEDFFYYSDCPQEDLFNKPRYQWGNPVAEEGHFQLSQKALDEAEASKRMLPGEAVPPNALGLAVIPVDATAGERNIRITFNTLRTYWEYVVKAGFDFSEWNFLIEDKEAQWEFENTVSAGTELRFRSKDHIPYQKKASNRLTLKWKADDDQFQFKTHKKTLPYPNYRYRQVSGEAITSPVFIQL